jgi:hypothetical protein
MLGSEAQAATEGAKVMCKNTLEVCPSEEETYLIAEFYCAGQLDGFLTLLGWLIHAGAQKKWLLRGLEDAGSREPSRSWEGSNNASLLHANVATRVLDWLFEM